MRPHFRKCAHFEKIYPFPLESNEWLVKWETGELTPTGRKQTYNPDYFCPSTGFYIEVVTSEPNISAQRLKWKSVLKRGNKLKIYWWEGQEITEQFVDK